MKKVKVPPKRIAIIGLPNTGKSQVFNNLTNKYTMVANFPFTTVEMKSGTFNICDQTYEVIDTPGIHCLYIHSEEELFVRDLLVFQQPDIIIQCIDATRLKQSLTLTFDLLELGIPMVISLNAIDEIMKKGIWIDSESLSKNLGVPVIESVTINDIGTKELKSEFSAARKGKAPVQYGEIMEEGIIEIEKLLPGSLSFKRKLSLLILLEDPYLIDSIRNISELDNSIKIREKTKEIRSRFRNNISWFINQKKNAWIESICSRTIRKQEVSRPRFSEKFASISRHPVYGIPILLGFIIMMFYSVVYFANVITAWMHDVLWFPIENQINQLVPAGFWNEFLVGDYGLLTFGVSNAILTVLPILSVFFLLFNTIEDMGYIPNLSVLLKRFSEKVGLSGSAIMPITLGFGCKTMATLTTKSLRSKKERYIAIYLIAFALPCAPQMALNMSILGNLGARAFVIALGFLVLVEIVAGLFLNKILKNDSTNDFIQALPDIRMPNPRAVIKKTYYKLSWFLKEAIPIFVYSALFLFVTDKIGLLGALKNILKPLIIGFLGFPIEMVDVLILCMARHEAAAGMIIKLIQAGKLNYIQCIVAVTITTMFVPCVANIMAMIKELKLKSALIMVIAINASAFVLAGILNRILIITIK
ncbi:MAG: ferrous iron transport protein B [Candidatus Omnitrophica bacterium]|nr:ferrous iron transport protein B [Candidatus Omnitrophota bacterium]MBU1997404.1 ferrous iron transport protein B [Candidatus Omnitrophota bacterium]